MIKQSKGLSHIRARNKKHENPFSVEHYRIKIVENNRKLQPTLEKETVFLGGIFKA